jgi:hypothetical protein
MQFLLARQLHKYWWQLVHVVPEPRSDVHINYAVVEAVLFWAPNALNRF